MCDLTGVLGLTAEHSYSRLVESWAALPEDLTCSDLQADTVLCNCYDSPALLVGTPLDTDPGGWVSLGQPLYWQHAMI